MMENCGTCKHWEREHGVCHHLFLDYRGRRGQEMVLFSSPWGSRLEPGLRKMSTCQKFGCVHWEEILGPFYVDSWTYSEGTRWSVHWSNKPGHCVQVTSSEHSEDEANGVCKILNELWAGRDE